MKNYKDYIIKENIITGVMLKDLKKLMNEEEWKDFEQFSIGQTNPILKGELCIFLSNVENFIIKNRIKIENE